MKNDQPVKVTGLPSRTKFNFPRFLESHLDQVALLIQPFHKAYLTDDEGRLTVKIEEGVECKSIERSLTWWLQQVGCVNFCSLASKMPCVHSAQGLSINIIRSVRLLVTD